MKFSEKLQKLRKTNNLSQEQLADMLEVTRQSVSKWESGQTYPEMDKLISMCKIFKCSLDDLTNDEISDTTILENKKSNINSLVDNILELITKTYHMFKSMNTVALIKCIITMGVIALVLLLFKIPFNYLSDQLYLIFSVIPNEVVEGLLTNVFNLIINLCYAALYIFVLIYIFKIGYLDKYKNIELEKEVNDAKKETKEDIKVEAKPRKEKEIHHHSDAIFNFLGKLIMIMIKFFVVCFSIPFIFSLLGLSVSFAVVFLLLFKKIIYIGVLLGILFAIILNVLIIKLVIDFLFNRKVNAKHLFITFMIGIIGVGVSSGIFCLEIASTKYIDAVPQEATIKVESKVIDFENNMFYPTNFNKEVEYKVDNSLTNTVKLELHYYDKYTNFNINKYPVGNYMIIESHQNTDEKVWDLLELIMKDLSKKELHNYGKLYDQKLVIYSSEANINKMKNNCINYTKEREAIESKLETEYNEYETTINELNERINELEQNNTTYEEEKAELEAKNEELQNKINEYKDRIKDMINE